MLKVKFSSAKYAIPQKTLTFKINAKGEIAIDLNQFSFLLLKWSLTDCLYIL